MNILLFFIYNYQLVLYNPLRTLAQDPAARRRVDDQLLNHQCHLLVHAAVRHYKHLQVDVLKQCHRALNSVGDPLALGSVLCMQYSV